MCQQIMWLNFQAPNDKLQTVFYCHMTCSEYKTIMPLSYVWETIQAILHELLFMNLKVLSLSAQVRSSKDDSDKITKMFTFPLRH